MKKDKEILKLLEADPNAGMTLLMEQYMGLVHSVASGLHDPEDVKDCINGTFADFYLHRSSFDPDKGSLTNYLAAIARRNCIDIAAAQKKHTAEQYPENAGEDPVKDWDERMDVRSAIDRLPAMDAELIRMKYYQGKTLSEIADSLDISYEATKKRHQRSLVALKKALITMLLLALLAALAACTYVVMRYFGIVPGYGLQTDPTETQYVLSEGETVQSDHFRITVEDAWLHGNALDIRIRYEWSDLNTDISVLSQEEYWYWYEQMQLGDGIGGDLDPVMNTSNWKTGIFTTTYTLYDPQLIEDQDGLVCILLFDGAQICFRVSETEPQELEQAGYSVITEEGGFYALPRIEDGHLYVQIYPIDPENYTIDRNLSAYYLKYQFGLSGDVTATAEDGTVLTGSINRNTEQVSDAFYEWDFGVAEPGDYILNIPFVFVSREYSIEDTDTFKTVISFQNSQPVTNSLPEGDVTLGPIGSLEPTEDGQFHCWIPVDAEIDTPYQLLVLHLQFSMQHIQDSEEMISVVASPVIDNGRVSGYNVKCSEEILSAVVWPKSLDFLWECDINIPIRAN